MTGLPAVQDKLAKLVLMLGSDRDGEVIASAHAIGRTLKAAGQDWHALAAALVRPAPFRAEPPRQPAGAENESRPSRRFLERIVNADWLTPWEREFVSCVLAQVRRSPHQNLSPKQHAVVERLIAKATVRGVRW